MSKYVVIARHGLCDNSITNRLLTERGEAQMKRLAVMLNPFLAIASPLRIYTSIARWTIQSAEILGAQYNIRPIEFPALFMSDPNNDLRNITELIARLIGINTLILMTHERGTSYLAEHCAKVFFQKNTAFPHFGRAKPMSLIAGMKKSSRFFLLTQTTSLNFQKSRFLKLKNQNRP